MSLRFLFIASLWLGAYNNSTAMDVSPFTVGQVVNTEQAQELKQKYDGRKVQPWKTAQEVNSIKGREDADLINYGIQILDKTASTIGPLVKDQTKKF